MACFSLANDACLSIDGTMNKCIFDLHRVGLLVCYSILFFYSSTYANGLLSSDRHFKVISRLSSRFWTERRALRASTMYVLLGRAADYYLGLGFRF